MDREEPASVLDRGRDFEPIADDSGIGEQTAHFLGIVACDEARLELAEDFPVALALGEDRHPGQAGLRALENEQLEQRAIVVLRNAPLFIVIWNRERSSRPRAANYVAAAGANDGTCGRKRCVRSPVSAKNASCP